MKIFKKNKKVKKALELIIIIFIFTVSVLIRIPNLNQHLSDHWEWLTAHTLVELRIWYEDGALKSKFTHIFNFPNDADKFINNASMSRYATLHATASDHKGNYYYLSHPVLAIVVPYIFFRLFSIYPDVLGLQIFNLVCHFLCAIFIYFIINFLTEKGEKTNFPAILGAALYLLLPGNLWYHSNVYFVEIFVQLPFIISIFLVTIYFKNPNLPDKNKNILLSFIGIAIFCTIYTEWIGVFLSLSLLVYCLINIKKSRDYIKIFLVVLISTFVAIAIFILQNSSVVGFKSVMNYLKNQFLFRSSVSKVGNTTIYIKNIAKHYLIVYFSLFIILAFILILLSLNIRRTKTKNFLNKYGLTMYLSFLPAIIHNIIFSNFSSIHDFSVLKTSVFLILFVSFLLNETIELNVFRDKFKLVSFLLIVLFVFQLSFNLYKHDKLFAGAPINEKLYTFGQTIKKEAKPDEVVFVIWDIPTYPQLNFYSHRNLVFIKNIDEAKQWLRNSENKLSKGILFKDLEKNIFERFTVDK